MRSVCFQLELCDSLQFTQSCTVNIYRRSDPQGAARAHFTLWVTWTHNFVDRFRVHLGGDLHGNHGCLLTNGYLPAKTGHWWLCQIELKSVVSEEMLKISGSDEMTTCSGLKKLHCELSKNERMMRIHANPSWSIFPASKTSKTVRVWSIILWLVNLTPPKRTPSEIRVLKFKKALLGKPMIPMAVVSIRPCTSCTLGRGRLNSHNYYRLMRALAEWTIWESKHQNQSKSQFLSFWHLKHSFTVMLNTQTCHLWVQFAMVNYKWLSK